MIEPGQIVTRDLGRKFRISTGGGRSLKASVLGREKTAFREFWALRHLDLDVSPGETFGVVGRNGSGKSTLLKMLARIYGPSEGQCQVGGRLSSLLELGAGFHPEFNAVENVYLAGAVYGIPKKELERDIDEIIGFAELEEFAYQPIKTYSSGMFMRLGFSVAMHVRPDVLLLDEVLAVGDERFVQKCLGRIAQFRREGGTMLLVTHDPATVERLCERALLLERGSPVVVGPAREVMAEYHHRLAEAQGADNETSTHTEASAQFRVETAVLDAAGANHHQFEEGQPFTIAIGVTSESMEANAVVWVVFHDEVGREIGGRMSPPLKFEAGASRVLAFDVAEASLRNGLFLVDVRVSDTASGQRLFEAKAAETVSIYGDNSASSGPMRISGDWDLG